MQNKIYIPKDKNLLDPKVDSTFKTLFIKDGEASKTALKGLVRAITGHKPEDVTIINNELPKDIENAKNIRLDLQCRLAGGERIGIEMQTCRTGDDLKARTFFYGCKMVSSVGQSGDSYMDIPKVYQVMFTDFNPFGDKSSYLQSFVMRNEETVLTDMLRVIFVQLPLLKESGKEVKNFTDIEKWVIFLRDSTDKSKRDLLNEIMASDEGIREAGEILMTISEDEKEWARQISRLKGEWDFKSSVVTAKREGLAEGRAEGEQIGEKHGLETAARGMKAENIPIETIVKITGLTPEQVAAL
ncbi:MAG: Rpn family recombination-promoting nuclease/putative transposase [Spirochaetia bacterium]|nr:Rpn family recombination-promoting nuclease/putative transposase [Spirochaetia bacterium]